MINTSAISPPDHKYNTTSLILDRLAWNRNYRDFDISQLLYSNLRALRALRRSWYTYEVGPREFEWCRALITALAVSAADPPRKLPYDIRLMSEGLVLEPRLARNTWPASIFEDRLGRPLQQTSMNLSTQFFFFGTFSKFMGFVFRS